MAGSTAWTLILPAGPDGPAIKCPRNRGNFTRSRDPARMVGVDQSFHLLRLLGAALTVAT
jgi:hypothetical protein